MPDTPRASRSSAPPGTGPEPTTPSGGVGPAAPGAAPVRVHVVLPASLTAPSPAEELTCEAASVGDLLDAVAAARPRLGGRLLYGGRPLVSVVLNRAVLAPQAAMRTALADGDRVELMPPVAGG